MEIDSAQRTKIEHDMRESHSTLREIFSDNATDAAVMGFLLCRLPQDGPVLWVQDRLTRLEAGVPYAPGFGVRLLRLDVSRAVDVLTALEDGLNCAGIAAAVGEVWGDPPALSFTATKRLALRAERSGVPCWLIRRSAVPNLSAARERWRVASVPSELNTEDPRAPGSERWHTDLFRARVLGEKPFPNQIGSGDQQYKQGNLAEGDLVNAVAEMQTQGHTGKRGSNEQSGKANGIAIENAGFDMREC